MNIFKKLSIAFLLLLVLLIGGVVVLLTTTTGLHFAINTAVRFVPGLSIEKVEGNWRNLALTDTRFEMPGVKVSIGDLFLSLDLSCLRHSQFCSDRLALKDVEVVVDTAMLPASEEEEDPEPLDQISVPFPLFLRQVVLENVNVAVDDMVIKLTSLNTGANWRQSTITLLPTELKSLLIALPKAAPEPGVAAEQPLAESLQQLFDQPLLSSLPDVKLPLDVVIEQLNAEDLRLTGDAPIALKTLQLRASLQGTELKLEQLNIRAAEGEVYLLGQASLSEQWPLKLTLNGALNIAPVKGEKIKLGLEGELLGDLKLSLNLSGPVRAQIDAGASLATAGLPLSLTLTSSGVKWPLQGDSDIVVGKTELELSGKATDYLLKLSSSLSGPEIPPATLSLEAKGNVQQFRLTQLLVQTLQGKLNLSGVADWSKAISWNSLLTIDGIDTTKQWPKWPARLSGKVTTRGSLFGGSWQLEVPTLDINGNFKKNKVSLLGSLKGNAAGQWNIPNLLIQLGSNKIEAKGRLTTDKWSLDTNVNMPNLSGTLPGLAGSAKGQIKLRGSLKAPQVLADMAINELRWQEFSVGKVTLKGDVTSAEQVRGSLVLVVDHLRQGSLRFRQITLQASGNEQSHRLTMDAEGRPVGGSLMLQGRFDRAAEIWRGSLSQAKFNTPVGEWKLQQPININYQNKLQKATVGSHCWHNPNAELCAPREIEVGASGNASIVLNRLDLAMIRPMLEGIDIKGIFTGHADVRWTDDGEMPQANLAFESKDIQVKALVDGASFPLSLDAFTISAAMTPNTAQANWRISVANNGEFRGNIHVADPKIARILSGDIVIDKFSLAAFQPLLTRTEVIGGTLNSALRLSGNAKRPQIFGKMDLSQLDLDLQVLPVTIKQSNINLSFNGMNSVLSGDIKTERGYLVLKGDADWQNVDAWRASVTAKGERIRIVMPPIVSLDVSPDLLFSATPSQLSLTGSVGIPWARIVVEELPESVVGVSPDEVILNSELQPITEQATAIPITTDLAINIGNDVTLSAFGLKASLKGVLRVIQDQRGLGLHGQIDIPSGSFRAYGQALVIRTGQLIFSGPPEQPRLNIEAIRDPESTEDGVTAGLRVTGLADQPQLEVFSDPAMSQEEALSYLLRGQGLSSRGEDGSMMTSMLIGMGVAQSGRLVGKIGETFGVKNLSLDTQGVGDSSQVVVSGYVLPNLQVRYGIGIFDSLATLTLRYRLMPRLYLEAVSGLDQALDILYQFEF